MLKDDLMQLSEEMVAISNGRLRLAFNEDDASESPVADAAHFLKLDGKRVGRDIELYGFMAKMMGNGAVIADFLSEVLLPIQQCKESFTVGLDRMEQWAGIFPEDMQAEWREMVNSFRPVTSATT